LSYFPHIRFVHNLTKPQGPFALGAFLRQNMAMVGFFKYDLSRTGHFKPLRGGPVGFNFWHEISSPGD
jgi:hypothetical protein